MMTINDAVLYIILIWPIGLIFLYFLFGKWMGPEKKKSRLTKDGIGNII